MLVLVQVECGGHRLQDPRSAGVHHPGRDVPRLEVVRLEQLGDLVVEVFLDDGGQAGGEHDLEPAVRHPPAEIVLSSRVEDAAGTGGGRRPGEAGRVVVADHDHGGGSVPEQSAGDQVRRRAVTVLEGQRAELDRDEEPHAVRMPGQVVVDPGDPGGAAGTAQTEGRYPPDVRPQSRPRDEQGVEGRCSDPRDGREQQEVHVGRIDPGRVQGLGHRPGRKVGTGPHEMLVRRPEGSQTGVSLEGGGRGAGSGPRSTRAAGRADADARALPPGAARAPR